MKQYITEIYYLLGNDRKKIPGLVMLFLGISLFDLAGLGLIGPYITLVVSPDLIYNSDYWQWLVWLGLPQDQKPLLITLSLALVGIFFLKAVASIGINYIILRFSLSQQLRLRVFLMEAYQSLSYADYLNRNSSEYIYSIQNLTGQFANSVVLNGVRALGDIIIATVVFIMLAWSNGIALTLLASLLGIMVFGYDRVFRHKLRAYGAYSNQATISIVQGIHEGIEGLKEIRVLGKAAYFLQKVIRGAQEYKYYQVRLQLISLIPRNLLEFVLISFIVLLVIMTLVLHDTTSEIIPVLGIFGVAAMRLIPIFNGFSSTLNQLRYSRDSVSRLYSDLSAVRKTEFVSSPLIYDSEIEPFLSLQVNQLSYRYPKTDSLVLSSISLEIKSGESIGLIGTSGSGKTTLVDIILGLLEPTNGTICYNNHQLVEKASEWCSQIAYLPQQVFLIDNTLRNNIALGVADTEIDDKKLYESLRQAQLLQAVDQLPNGIDTLLGERGVRLSGGQRQRVALARAFYHGRSILVMDEATSALDSETELEIVNEIKQLKGKKTIIVIAHRLTTLQYCDRIYELNNGEIINTRTYDEVISKA